MIINPVKKAHVLFNKLKLTEDKEKGKRYSEANQFYSWHANYIIVDRKKVIILVNDLTLLPLLINDVNAKAKPELDRIIETGIRTIFQLVGVSEKDIKLYFEMAGEIKINTAYNRKTIGHINNYLYYLEEIDLRERYPLDLCLYLAEVPHMEHKGSSSAARTLKVFSEGINLNDGWQEEYRIEKNWIPFSNWSKYEGKEWFESYDDVAEEVRNNNRQLLSEFEAYLLNKESLSKSTVSKYVSALEDYTNTYLLYFKIATVVTDMDEVNNFLNDFYVRKFMWASKTNLQHTARAMKKLYEFLYEAEEISKDDLKLVKSNITDSVKEGIEYMESRMFDL